MGNLTSSERSVSQKQLQEWEEDLQQREQALQLREKEGQRSQPPVLRDLWLDSGLSSKKSNSVEVRALQHERGSL